MSYYLYLLLVTITLVMALSRWKNADFPVKLMIILMILTWITEFAGAYYMYAHRNNIIVYLCAGSVELLILMLYYMYWERSNRKMWGLYGLLVLMCFVYVLLVYFTTKSLLYVYVRFLLIESLLVSIWVILFLFRKLLPEAQRVKLSFNRHFWFSMILLTYSCTNIPIQFILEIGLHMPSIELDVNLISFWINTLVVLGFLLVFVFHNRFSNSYGDN